MNESTRTVTYVVVAVVAVALALVLNPPKEITPETLTKANVGKEFYPDFKPADATSIRVVAFDEAKAKQLIFGVKLENGKWTIPTRYNYPVDGADRLAKTATSVRHIKREELASSSLENQEKFGVIDPLDKDLTKLKGRGQRITLNKGDTPLVDLIIGKQVKDRPGFFYIRKPDEPATYVAKVSIDLSTKFSDWIETDLLKLDRNDLTEMEVVMNFEFQNANGRPKVVPGETNTLARDKPADPWKLEDLEAGEEVDITKVNEMVTTLDDLKLVGVRPKPKGFKPDLTFDREFVKKQSDLDELVNDLHNRGFELVPDVENKMLKMYGDAGELIAGTNKGVVYTLKFGSVFLGDDTEIEVGGAADKEKADEKPTDEAAADDKAKASEGKKSSRYLFVMAGFDEKLLGQPPQKPAPPEEIAAGSEPAPKPKTKAAKKEPVGDDADKEKTSGDSKGDSKGDSPATPDEKPAENKPTDKKPAAEAAKDPSSKDPDENCLPVTVADDDAASTGEKTEKAADDKKDDKQPADDKADEKPQAEKKAPESKEAEKKETGKKPEDDEPAADAKPQPAPQEEKKKSAEELKKEYDGQLKKYESDLKIHQDKVAAGKKQAEELNARFANWYYVISAENFNKLHLSRKELVKEKAKEKTDDKKPGDDKNLEPKDEDPEAPSKDPLESLDEDDKKPEKKPE